MKRTTIKIKNLNSFFLDDILDCVKKRKQKRKKLEKFRRNAR